VLKTKADGVARVLKSASALRRGRGLRGQGKLTIKPMPISKSARSRCSISPTSASSYRWIRHHGSGRKIVFTQRLKRSGMSWTIAGGQVILDLRVIR